MSNNTATIKTRKNLVSTGTIRFTCTDWGVCFWTGYRSDDRIDKKYITASVNINRRNW